MRVVHLRSAEEKARGLIGMSPIPEDTLFVFRGWPPGTVFHSRGVLEPFDILFIGPEPGSVALRVVMPADGVAVPPPGATMAVEAKAGTVMRIGPAAVVEAALGRT